MDNRTIVQLTSVKDLQDGDQLERVCSEFLPNIKFYDDGFGKLYVLFDSMGIVGFVRALTWEDAFGCAEDELFPEADEATGDDFAKECDYTGPIDNLMENAIFQENYGFRPNGPNATDKHKHGIYQKDLNGERLDEVSDRWLAEHGITVYVSRDTEDA